MATADPPGGALSREDASRLFYAALVAGYFGDAVYRPNVVAAVRERADALLPERPDLVDYWLSSAFGWLPRYVSS